MLKYKGFYFRYNDTDVFLRKDSYYLKDAELKTVMLKLGMFDIDKNGLNNVRNLLIRATLYVLEQGVYKLKVKNEHIKTLDNIFVINLNTFKLVV